MKQIFFIFVILSLNQISFGSNEILSILDTATDLTPFESDSLRPLFKELQKQYDFIVGQSERQPDSGFQIDLNTWQMQHSQQENDSFLPNFYEVSHYDIDLPSIDELLKEFNTQEMSEEERLEFQDLKEILEETLIEAEVSIKDLIKRSADLESLLLRLNKPKIIMYIYNALGVLYGVAGRAARAAYCSYYYSSQLNDSLLNVYDGVDCYLFTSSLVLEIQHQTVYTIKSIRQNVLALTKIYKKIAGKNSLLGKILTGVLNVQKILRNLREALSVAMAALDKVENQLPEAGRRAASCGIDFAKKIPSIIESVRLLAECILFQEEPAPEYEFLKPESERNF